MHMQDVLPTICREHLELTNRLLYLLCYSTLFDSILLNNCLALSRPRISFSFSSDSSPFQESSSLITLSLVSGVRSFIALSITFILPLARSLGLNTAPI